MAQQHAHKLKRIALGNKGYKVYKCMLPGCSYHVRTELAVGVIAKCWRCAQDFIMTPGTAKQAKPHCCKNESYEVQTRNLRNAS